MNLMSPTQITNCPWLLNESSFVTRFDIVQPRDIAVALQQRVGHRLTTLRRAGARDEFVLHVDGWFIGGGAIKNCVVQAQVPKYESVRLRL